MRTIREQGFTNIAVVEAQNVYNYSYRGRRVPAVAELCGYTGNGYRILDLTEDRVPFMYGEQLGRHVVGPLVTGTFDGVNLRLQSEYITMTTGAGQQLTRTFLLVGSTPTISNTYVISGTYLETLWGFGKLPMTIVGSFNLVKPKEFVVPPAGNLRVFLPLMQR